MRCSTVLKIEKQFVQPQHTITTMKKLFMLLLAGAALTACSNDEDAIVNEEKIITQKFGNIEIKVQGNYVLSPEWIDRVRHEIVEDDRAWDCACVGITAKHNGVTVIYFWNSLSSLADSESYVYSLSGQKSDEKIPNSELTDQKVFCPAFMIDFGKE